MPKLIKAEEIAIEWEDLDKWEHRKQPPMKRSSGVHLSGIIHALSDRGGYKDSDEMPLRMALGMAWENWIIGMLPTVKWQPGEWECDGVYGTPDGLITKPLTLQEFKLTYDSIHKWKDPLEYNRWRWQLAGNCFVMGIKDVVLHVLWVNGDYKPPSPKYIRYSYNYTDEELQSFWDNVVMPNRELAKKEEH